MRLFLIFLIFPYCIISQEFYPGFLSQLQSPICYNSSTTLDFETLPSGDNINYSYQWQISWNESNWFDIPNANSISYETSILNSDTYYRVIVSYQDMSLPTNVIPVYVLSPLVAGVLNEIDSMCVNDGSVIEFAIESSGAEFNWGGFSNFSYQWERGDVSNVDFGTPSPVNWVNVGNDLNTHVPNLEEGVYYFRCFITSLHGCGTVVTDPIFVQINDCFNSNINEYSVKKDLIKTINILGQNSLENSLILNVYSNGSVEKRCIIK
tara:strand:+ start:431 stop:1225 length:795 start_codon:yes stop_codon:yes gene_type:complete